MRPQQQNRRMRGRNNSGGGSGSGNNNNNNSSSNNRKGPNPLTRNYESNGPDVKIRGSAQQIAEKYATLARDSHSSGDRVMAENYLQHAEHYNRIIAAAQAQMPVQNVQNNRDDFDDEGDEERGDFENNNNYSQSEAPQANHGSGPQPVIEGTPAEIALNTETPRENNGNREGGGRQQRERRPSGNYAQNGQRNEHPRGEHNNGSQSEQSQRNEAPVTPVAVEDAPVASEAPVEQAPKPVAVTRVAAPKPVVAAPAEDLANLSPAELAARAELNEAASEAAPRRPRRPRRPRVSADATGGDAGDAGEGASNEPAVSDS